MKQYKIFNEVISMLNSGADYQAITLSEIAKRCDMGKSTIYEYFKSKDEMIYSSLLFYIKKVIVYFGADWTGKDFISAFTAYINAVEVLIKANNWTVLPWTFDNYLHYFSKENQASAKKLLNTVQGIIIAVFESILKKYKTTLGIKNISENNIKFVFFAIVADINEKIYEDFDFKNEKNFNFIEDYVNLIKKQMI